MNAAGAVVRQHIFDAYGQLLYAEDLQAAPTSRIGHQGLFFDRLDAPQGSRDLTPRHAPTATPGIYTLAQIDGHYQNRNRTYAPHIGRWMQGDPNGTGSPVLASLPFHGRAPRSSVDAPDSDDLFTDGPSRHIAYGNSPVARTDPIGLFFGGIVGLFAPTAVIDPYADYNLNAIQNGARGFGNLASMLQTHQLDQELDVEWALDWEASDTDYAASGAGPMQAALAAMVLTGRAQNHHIATNKHSRYTPLFQEIFESAGMSMNNRANKMKIDMLLHSGPHSDSYHRRILHRLRAATDGHTRVEDARRALERELKTLAGEIRTMLTINPRALRYKPGHVPLRWRPR